MAGCGRGAERKETHIVTTDSKGTVLLPGERETISMPGNKVSFVHTEADSAYSMVEWAAEPGAPGTSVHFHTMTDETFYVLEGTFGFQVGEETLETPVGAFVFVPKGTKHAFWNQGPHRARLLVTMSPPEFWRYLKELAEGLAGAGDDAEASMSLREALSKKYDVEVVEPPRRATS
jgi:quercetin dioxygenase-like cupin family protein